MRIAAIVIVGIVLAGCSPTPTSSGPRNTGVTVAPPGAGNDSLRAIGTAYLSFQQIKGRPPKSFGELAAFGLDSSRPLPPGAGIVTVVWGKGMGEMCVGSPSEVILAFAPPTRDGTLVLFADGTTRVLSDAEFAAAKNADRPQK